MAESRTITVLADAGAVAAEAARRFALLARAAAADHGTFSVAMTGGTTPKSLYRLLGQPPLRDEVPWDHVFFFWSDERFVAPDDAESNFRLVRETLLDQISLPAANVFPVPTIGGTPEAAAMAYAETITATLGGDMRFDLVLLGVGPDGHTASLFPGRAEVTNPPAPYVIAVHDSPKPPPTRISFTIPLINAAAHVLVLATGAEKAEAVRHSLHPAEGETVPPAGLVTPTTGELVWLVDAAAAGEQ